MTAIFSYLFLIHLSSYSLEASQWDASNENAQHMFPHRNKTITNIYLPSMDKLINDLPIWKILEPLSHEAYHGGIIGNVVYPQKTHYRSFICMDFLHASLVYILFTWDKSMELLENIRISVFQLMQNFVHSIIMSLIITGTQVPGTASTVYIWL